MDRLRRDYKNEKLKDPAEALEYIMGAVHQWRLKSGEVQSYELIMAYLTINEYHDFEWLKDDNQDLDTEK